MFWWNRNRKYPTGTPLTPFLLLGAVCLGEIRVTSIAYDTARLPCSFNFIQGAEHLLVLWQKEGKDGKSVQVYKFENGEVNLTNQDSQFRGRTVFSGDVSLGKLDLTLVGVTQNDDAVYYCRAANKVNHGDNMVVLSVIALPPLMVQKAVEDNVTLVPKFSGVPTEINWKLNNNKLVDMELKPLERHFYRLADRADLQLNGSLTIRNLTKEDSGAYKSEAIVNNFIQETEIRLAVLDRVSKPIISDRSTDEQIILHCESSTINVSYKWIVDGRETQTTEQDYKAPRPEEGVVVSCSVNNTVSKDSQSILIIQYKTGFRRHRFYTILAVVLFLLFLIVILNVRCFIQVFWCERCWKFKKYERDDVEPIAYSPSNGKNLPEISERGRGYMCDENRDKICIDGFQKTEEDQRDAAELKYTGGLRPKQVLLRLSSDNDYFSDQSKEAPESDCVLEGDLASDNPQHVAGDVASDNLHLVTSDVASDNPQHTAGDVASDNLHLVTGDVASDNPQHVAGDMASDNLHLVTSDVASDTHLRLPLILHYGFQKTKRDKRDAAAPEYIANVQSDGYLKFYKTSSDSDYISKKSEEAPEPFRVLEGVGAVSVIQDPPHLILSVGETAKMSCDVRNTEKTPIHQHYWFMNGSWDFLNSSRVTVTQNSLTISSVTYNDSGLYICQVRDRGLKLHNGTGTYLSITERSDNTTLYYYLYSLIPLVLLLVVILCWRCSPRKESQIQPAEEGDGLTSTQEPDSDELHYSTIMHRPAGQRNREESNAMMGTDEVVYAPVRISTTYQPFTCDPTDMDQDLDATMRMSTPYTRHLELGIICLPTSQTPDYRTLVKNQLQPNQIH